MSLSLILAPAKGSSPLELVGITGIFLSKDVTVEQIMPVPVYEEEFAESRDSEGGLRSQSRPTNPSGAGQVWIDASGAGLAANIKRWEKTAQDLRKYGGTIKYTPVDGPMVIYTVASFRITAMPQDVIYQGQGVAQSEFEFTTLPYGLLDEVTVVSNANGTSPLVEFDIPELDGSVDALGKVLVTDTASQARHHVEGGMESYYYDPDNPWELLLDHTEQSALESASSTTRAASFSTNIFRQTVTTGQGIAFALGSHVGRFHVKARVYATLAADLRLGYAIRGNSPRYKDWQSVPVTGAWAEVDLGIVNIDPPRIYSGQSVSFSVYGRRTTGSATTVDLDWIKIIPAERYFKAHGSVGSVATVRSGRYMRVGHDIAETETANDVWAEHPASTGAYLRIPVEGGRMAVAVNRADIETEAHTPLGDAVRVDLNVVPRVALMGA